MASRVVRGLVCTRVVTYRALAVPPTTVPSSSLTTNAAAAAATAAAPRRAYRFREPCPACRHGNRAEIREQKRGSSGSTPTHCVTFLDPACLYWALFFSDVIDGLFVFKADQVAAGGCPCFPGEFHGAANLSPPRSIPTRRFSCSRQILSSLIG